MRSIDEHSHQAEAIRYQLLKLLQERSQIGQRALAQEMGISLGKVNYCLRALIDRGFVKATNFAANPNKRQYAYLLTPQGIDEKTRVTARFLQRKLAEFEAIRHEIERLKEEVGQDVQPQTLTQTSVATCSRRKAIAT